MIIIVLCKRRVFLLIPPLPATSLFVQKRYDKSQTFRVIENHDKIGFEKENKTLNPLLKSVLFKQRAFVFEHTRNTVYFSL